ncbi:MAG: MFS transporter, partial [Dehalococcoidia bacterium]|nr:MFS transporter [Dehalococcoidia bacterium]
MAHTSEAGPEADRRRAESLPAAIILVALSALAPLTVDMFLPSLPTMTEEFGAPASTMQLAVLLFILAFASSQLVYGPLSDRAGRRPALLAGLALFVVGGVIALFARTPEVLIAGRVVQGLGGGAGPALAQAMVLDVYGRERAARVLAYMAVALPLAPAIAPIIGGFLHEVAGWQSVFVTLSVLGVVLAVLYLVLLPETNPASRRATRAR